MLRVKSQLMQAQEGASSPAMTGRLAQQLFVLSLAVLSGCGDSRAHLDDPSAEQVQQNLLGNHATSEGPSSTKPDQHAYSIHVDQSILHQLQALPRSSAAQGSSGHQSSFGADLQGLSNFELHVFQLNATTSRRMQDIPAALNRQDLAVFFQLLDAPPEQQWLVLDPQTMQLLPVNRLNDSVHSVNRSSYGTSLVRALANGKDQASGSDLYQVECQISPDSQIIVEHPRRLTNSAGATCADPIILPLFERVVYRVLDKGIWRLMQIPLRQTRANSRSSTRPLLSHRVYPRQPWQIQQLEPVDAATVKIAANPAGFFAHYLVRIDQPLAVPEQHAPDEKSHSFNEMSSFLLSTADGMNQAGPHLFLRPESYDAHDIVHMVTTFNHSLAQLREAGASQQVYRTQQQEVLGLAVTMAARQRYYRLAAERWQQATEAWFEITEQAQGNPNVTRAEALQQRRALQECQQNKTTAMAIHRAAATRLRHLCGLGEGAPLELENDAATEWQMLQHLSTDTSEELALLNHPDFAPASANPNIARDGNARDADAAHQGDLAHAIVSEVHDTNFAMIEQGHRMSSAFADEIVALENLRLSRLATRLGSNDPLPTPLLAEAHYLTAQAERYQQHAELESAAIAMQQSTWRSNDLGTYLEDHSIRQQRRQQTGTVLTQQNWEALADLGWVQHLAHDSKGARASAVLWDVGPVNQTSTSIISALAQPGGADSLRLAIHRIFEQQGTFSLGVQITEQTQLDDSQVTANALANWQDQQLRFEPTVQSLHIRLDRHDEALTTKTQQLLAVDRLQQHFLALRQSNMPLWMTIRPDHALDQDAYEASHNWFAGATYIVPESSPNEIMRWLSSLSPNRAFQLQVTPDQLATVDAWRNHSQHASLKHFHGILVQSPDRTF
jgi:hypothetical protein